MDWLPELESASYFIMPSLSHHNHLPDPWTFFTTVAQHSVHHGSNYHSLCWHSTSFCLLWTCCSHVSLGMHWYFKAVICDMLPHQYSWPYKRLPPPPAYLRVLTKIFYSGLLHFNISTKQMLVILRLVMSVRMLLSFALSLHLVLFHCLLLFSRSLELKTRWKRQAIVKVNWGHVPAL